jgi:type IV secretion system protein VirD4
MTHPVYIGSDAWSFEEYMEAMFAWPPFPPATTVVVFWVTAIMLALFGMTKYDYGDRKKKARENKDKEYGDARWATEAEMDQFAHRTLVRYVSVRLPKKFRGKIVAFKSNKKRFLAGITGRKIKVPNPVPDYCEAMEDDNILLSETAAMQLSKIPDPLIERNKHVYILGGSGSGKTYNYVTPNLLQLNSSFLVTDPKGDTLKQFGSFLLNRGYKLKVVNTKAAELAYSMHYNPLMYLNDATDIMCIVTLLIENTSGDGEQSGEDFFVKAERQLYLALIGYLHYFYHDMPEHRTFAQLISLLGHAKAAQGKSVSVLDAMIHGAGNPGEENYVQGFERWVIDKYGSLSAAQRSDEWFVVTNYKNFKATAEAPETQACIISSCSVRLAPFTVGAVARMFEYDELELEKIGEEKTAFFLIMDDMDKSYSFILAMVLYQFFAINTVKADQSEGSHCKIPVNCILDELANIGKIPDLERKIATLRSRWINLHCILQNQSQLKDVYGAEAATIIEGNCDTQLVLGRLDFDSYETISKKLGKQTIVVKNTSHSKGGQGSTSESENRTGVELMTAADLYSNPSKFNGEQCIVMIKSAYPYLDYKYRTDDHPRARELRAAGEFSLPRWNYERERERERKKAEKIAEMMEGRKAMLAAFGITEEDAA